MIHIGRDVQNLDGETVRITVVFDLNGVAIVLKPSDQEPMIVQYTHEEAAAIHDLLDLARPAYKTGVETPE